MQKSVLLSALVALAVVPALVGCRSTQRARRSSNSPQASIPQAPAIPSAPMMPYAGPDGMGGDAYAGLMPGGSSYDSSPSFPQASAPPADSPELLALRAEMDRVREEQRAMQDELDRARNKVRESSDALVSLPPHSAGTGTAGMHDIPVDRALAELETSLRSQAGGAQVLRQGDRLIVRLTDVFRSGDNQLRSGTSAESAVQATAAALSRYPDARVSIVGHSDTSPIVKTKHLWSSNQHLSEARAQVVAGRLSSAGIPPSRIEVVGRGSSEPLVMPESTPADKARNRRVEIVISL